MSDSLFESSDYEERPMQRTDGSGLWDALDAHGCYGHPLGFKTRELVEVWLDGYNCGARENM